MQWTYFLFVMQYVQNFTKSSHLLVFELVLEGSLDLYFCQTQLGFARADAQI